MTKITAETTIPIRNSKKAKDATLILDGDQVQIKTPAMLSLPSVSLVDLEVAVEDLRAARDMADSPGLLRRATEITVDVKPPTTAEDIKRMGEAVRDQSKRRG